MLSSSEARVRIKAYHFAHGNSGPKNSNTQLLGTTRSRLAVASFLGGKKRRCCEKKVLLAELTPGDCADSFDGDQEREPDVDTSSPDILMETLHYSQVYNIRIEIITWIRWQKGSQYRIPKKKKKQLKINKGRGEESFAIVQAKIWAWSSDVRHQKGEEGGGKRKRDVFVRWPCSERKSRWPLLLLLTGHGFPYSWVLWAVRMPTWPFLPSTGSTTKSHCWFPSWQRTRTDYLIDTGETIYSREHLGED